MTKASKVFIKLSSKVEKAENIYNSTVGGMGVGGTVFAAGTTTAGGVLKKTNEPLTWKESKRVDKEFKRQVKKTGVRYEKNHPMMSYVKRQGAVNAMYDPMAHTIASTENKKRPSLLFHELGHAKAYGKKIGPKKIGLVASRNIGSTLASIGYLQGLTPSGSKAEKIIDNAATYGNVPMLLDEGHANYNVVKSMKRAKVGPKALRNAKTIALASMGSYLTAAVSPIVASKVSKSLKNKPTSKKSVELKTNG